MSWDLLNIDIWRQHIDNVPQDEISRYVAVSIFWHTPMLDANRLVLFGSLKAGIKGQQKNAIWKEITVAVNSVSNVRRPTEEVC